LLETVLKQMSSSLVNSSSIADQSQIEEIKMRMKVVRKCMVTLA